MTARQLRRFTVYADGSVVGPSGRKLSPFDVNGYLRVTGYREGKFVAEPIHRLVCEAYHGPGGVGEVVRHLDGDPHNNCVDNLKWGTLTENELDKATHGTSLRGERHHQSKLTEDQVRAIRTTPADVGHTAIAREYGVSRSTISSIRRGKTWSHLDS